MHVPKDVGKYGTVYKDDMLPVLYLVPVGRGSRRIAVLDATTHHEIDYWSTNKLAYAVKRTRETIAESIQRSVRCLRPEAGYMHFGPWATSSCGANDVQTTSDATKLTCPKCIAGMMTKLQSAMDKGAVGLTALVASLEGQ